MLANLLDLWQWWGVACAILLAGAVGVAAILVWSIFALWPLWLFVIMLCCLERE